MVEQENPGKTTEDMEEMKDKDSKQSLKFFDPDCEVPMSGIHKGPIVKVAKNLPTFD